MSGKKGKGTTLGRALMKKPQQDPKKNRGYVEEFAGPEQSEQKNLNSVIDHSDLGAIMDNALLENARFTAEKQNVVVLQTSAFIAPDKPSEEQIDAQKKHWNDLTIPRRPLWTSDMSAQELDKKEKAAFLAWRRKLADIEENDHLLLTPFEKNIEVWRQLWRVLERSDMVVQILDSRDPLLFRSLDLEKYVAEFKNRQPYPQDKIMMLLLNKADLLSPEQRKKWAEYFTKEGIRFVFFSAYTEQVKLNEDLKDAKQKHIEEVAAEARRKASGLESVNEDETDEEDEADDADDADDNAADEMEDDNEPSSTTTDGAASAADTADSEEASSASAKTTLVDVPPSTDHVFTREELFSYFVKVCNEELKEEKEHIMVGMVGYPNVGKSSTINVLYHRKKVAVSATPGKTKHFQTLKVNEYITLCDCPGLVFPTFMSTRAEMIASGLLRIDEMKEFLGPVSIVARRIPRIVLEHTYGIELPGRDPLTATKFLQIYAEHRGFATLLGKADEAKAARIVLKDYVNGRLLFCRAPPDVDQDAYSTYTVHPTLNCSTSESTVTTSSPTTTEEEGQQSQDGGDEDDDENDEAVETPDDGFPKPSQRPKHQRINKKMERRLKHMDEREPGRNLDMQKSIGVYVGMNPGAHPGRLPTSVRLVKQGKRPVALVKVPAKK